MGAARSSRATGAAAIALTIAPGYAWRLHEIRVHLSAGGGASNLTATIDHGEGAVYDSLIYTKAMAGLTDVEEQWTTPRYFGADDELDIAYLNGGAATYGIEVIYTPA